MAFCVPNAPNVKIVTENGIARQVFIDGNEVRMVSDVDMTYGINDLPTVKITFMAKVEIVNKELNDGLSGSF